MIERARFKPSSLVRTMWSDSGVARIHPVRFAFREIGRLAPLKTGHARRTGHIAVSIELRSPGSR